MIMREVVLEATNSMLLIVVSHKITYLPNVKICHVSKHKLGVVFVEELKKECSYIRGLGLDP